MAGVWAHALEAKTVEFIHVYGTGWSANGGWVEPMTESAADAMLQMQSLNKNHVTCSVKAVTKATLTDSNTMEFFGLRY